MLRVHVRSFSAFCIIGDCSASGIELAILTDSKPEKDGCRVKSCTDHQYFLSVPRSLKASATWEASMVSLPARSAIVLESLRILA